MTRMLPLIVLSGLLALPTTPALAQTVDEIVDKHLAATGGRELRSQVATGSISISTPVGDLPGTIEVFTKAPNKSRTLIKLDLTSVGAGQVVVDQRFDGNAGYVLDSLNGNREITGSQLDAMRTTASFPTPLFGYRDKGSTVQLIGREKAGTRDSYALRLLPKGGKPVKLLIDSESFMLLGMSMTLNVPELGGDVEQVTEFSDYRDVGGVKVPYGFKSTNPAQTVTVTVNTVTHNVEIDDTSFSKPAQ